MGKTKKDSAYAESFPARRRMSIRQVVSFAHGFSGLCIFQHRTQTGVDSQ